MKTKMESHFGECKQDKFYSFKEQYEYSCPVDWSPKYETARLAAFGAMAKYGLAEEDFWIKKSLSQFKDKIIYENLILSHSGCIKVNDQQPKERQFKPSCVKEAKGTADGGVALLYSSDEQCLFKTGEASPRNSNVSYLYAVAEKRLFDRVVTALSGLYEAGIYGETEAESFAKGKNASAKTDVPAPVQFSAVQNVIPEPEAIPEPVPLSMEERSRRIEYIKKGAAFTNADIRKMCDFYGVFDFAEMDDASLIDCTSKMETKIANRKTALRNAQTALESNGQVVMPVASTPVQQDQGLSPIAAMLMQGGEQNSPQQVQQPVQESAPAESSLGETVYTVTAAAPQNYQDLAGQTFDQIGKDLLRGLYRRQNAAGRKYVDADLLKKIEAYIA